VRAPWPAYTVTSRQPACAGAAAPPASAAPAPAPAAASTAAAAAALVPAAAAPAAGAPAAGGMPIAARAACMSGPKLPSASRTTNVSRRSACASPAVPRHRSTWTCMRAGLPARGTTSTVRVTTRPRAAAAACTRSRRRWPCTPWRGRWEVGGAGWEVGGGRGGVGAGGAAGARSASARHSRGGVDAKARVRHERGRARGEARRNPSGLKTHAPFVVRGHGYAAPLCSLDPSHATGAAP
jgi:hypothetical protein